MIETLKGRVGYRISLYTGCLERNHFDRWSMLFYKKANAGDKISMKDNDIYEYAVATYSFCREDKYIYTYDYQPEENWATYEGTLTPDSYRQADYVFKEDCYFRVNARRLDGQELLMPDGQKLDALFSFESNLEEDGITKCNYLPQIREFSDKVNSTEGRHFLLICDTHYCVNGTWDNSFGNIKAAASRIKLDGIIHLGDFTDGLCPKEVNAEYVRRIYSDLKELEVPMYVTLGNHDSNYFWNNPETFSEKEQYELYLREINTEDERLYYYKDFPDLKLRMFFLHSHDYREENRYGYSDEELYWFKCSLAEMPTDYKAIIFSHCPPLARYHYWNKIMRNGEKMLDAARRANAIAWIHGHNHADAIWYEDKLPIVSIGCNKLEDFKDKKPEGSVVPDRKAFEYSEDLWDVMTISKDTIIFNRFGAGEDRRL